MRSIARRLGRLEAQRAQDRRGEYLALLEEIAARDDSGWQSPTIDDLRHLQASVGVPSEIMGLLFPNWIEEESQR